MRRSYLILGIVMFSLSLFSCETDSIADIENDQIETLATEGEDDEIIDEEDGD